MLNDKELVELIEDLTSEDAFFRAATLKVLWEYPSADPRVLPDLEELLNDKTPCILAIPYVFGEIRWLAAHALAAERAALGINEPIYLLNVVRPAETRDIIKAEYEAGIKARGGVDGLLENLALARSLGYMPLYDLDLSPLDKRFQQGIISIHRPALEHELVPA
jgi:hypothetical protein